MLFQFAGCRIVRSSTRHFEPGCEKRRDKKGYDERHDQSEDHGERERLKKRAGNTREECERNMNNDRAGARTYDGWKHLGDRGLSCAEKTLSLLFKMPKDVLDDDDCVVDDKADCRSDPSESHDIE